MLHGVLAICSIPFESRNAKITGPLIGVIKKERERLFRAFVQLDIFRSVFPSEANFILVTLDDFRELYDFLVQQKMVVRLRNIPPLVEGGLRISIGVPEENDRLLALLAEWKSEKKTEVC